MNQPLEVQLFHLKCNTTITFLFIYSIYERIFTEDYTGYQYVPHKRSH